SDCDRGPSDALCLSVPAARRSDCSSRQGQLVRVFEHGVSSVRKLGARMCSALALRDKTLPPVHGPTAGDQRLCDISSPDRPISATIGSRDVRSSTAQTLAPTELACDSRKHASIAVDDKAFRLKNRPQASSARFYGRTPCWSPPADCSATPQRRAGTTSWPFAHS